VTRSEEGPKPQLDELISMKQEKKSSRGKQKRRRMNAFGRGVKGG